MKQPLLILGLLFFLNGYAQKQFKKTGLLISVRDRTAFFESKHFILDEFRDLKVTQGLETPSLEMFNDLFKSSIVVKVIIRVADDKGNIQEDTVNLRYVPVTLIYGTYKTDSPSAHCAFMFKWKNSEFEMNFLCNLDGIEIRNIKRYKAKGIR